MLILLDQDGVLANFEQGFITNWHQRFGEEPPIAGQDHLFYVRDRLPEHLRHHAAEIFGAEGFFEQLPHCMQRKPCLRPGMMCASVPRQ